MIIDHGENLKYFLKGIIFLVKKIEVNPNRRTKSSKSHKHRAEQWVMSPGQGQSNPG